MCFFTASEKEEQLCLVLHIMNPLFRQCCRAHVCYFLSELPPTPVTHSYLPAHVWFLQPDAFGSDHGGAADTQISACILWILSSGQLSVTGCIPAGHGAQGDLHPFLLRCSVQAPNPCPTYFSCILIEFH